MAGFDMHAHCARCRDKLKGTDPCVSKEDCPHCNGRDVYIAHVNVGIKQDTLSALRQAPLHLHTLFPDQSLKKAEEDIAQHEEKGRSTHSSSSYKNVFTLTKGLTNQGNKSPANRLGKPLVLIARKGRASPQSIHHVRPRASLLNGNYCVNFLLSRRLARSKQTLNINQCHQTGPKTVNCVQYNQTGPESGQTLKTCQPVINFPDSVVVNHAHIVKGQPQKKGVSLAVIRQCQPLKYVNNVSCIDQLCSVKNTPNVQTVAQDLPVGARLHQFSQLGNFWGQTKGNKNPQRGLHPSLPDPPEHDKVTYHHKLLCQSPQEPLPDGGITSAYEQKCSRAGPKPRISGILQLTIFGAKTKQPVETYTRSQQPEQIPQGRKFKMETPETIKTSLQIGEWVTSIDVKDDYFHIPIQSQSRKYLRFHIQGQTYHFKALPFGLSTAPM